MLAININTKPFIFNLLFHSFFFSLVSPTTPVNSIVSPTFVALSTGLVIFQTNYLYAELIALSWFTVMLLLLLVKPPTPSPP